MVIQKSLHSVMDLLMDEFHPPPPDIAIAPIKMGLIKFVPMCRLSHKVRHIFLNDNESVIQKIKFVSKLVPGYSF